MEQLGYSSPVLHALRSFVQKFGGGGSGAKFRSKTLTASDAAVEVIPVGHAESCGVPRTSKGCHTRLLALLDRICSNHLNSKVRTSILFKLQLIELPFLKWLEWFDLFSYNSP